MLRRQGAVPSIAYARRDPPAWERPCCFKGAVRNRRRAHRLQIGSQVAVATADTRSARALLQELDATQPHLFLLCVSVCTRVLPGRSLCVHPKLNVSPRCGSDYGSALLSAGRYANAPCGVCPSGGLLNCHRGCLIDPSPLMRGVCVSGDDTYIYVRTGLGKWCAFLARRRPC